jgi:ribonuclease BN (tRNA processing enzyme)
MKLQLLGTAGYHPNDRRQTACLMLPELGIVLDAGTAFYRVHEYLCTEELDVFLTHAHLDHVVGLTYLFDVVRERNLRRVTVHGMADKLAAIKTHLLAEQLFPAQPPCEFRPLIGPVALSGGGQLSYFPVEHPGGAVGFRLDWPEHSVAYVTDTTASPQASYAQAVQGVNLLVHECNFSDNEAELAVRWGHSSLSAVARLAAAASVGEVVLVHLSPRGPDISDADLRAARQIFSPLTVGDDRQEIDF